jgi:Bacterial SH3 domain
MNAALKSLQLLLGMIAGLVGLIGILGGAGYYFFVTQMSTRPPKPVFAEERDGGKSIAAKPKPKVAGAAKPTQPPVVAKDPKNPGAPEKLAPEAYDAKVLWKDGLSLKKEPDSGAEKVGGVAFNAKVAIVKTSDDKQWVLIQSQTDNLQGWVKAGNIDKAAAAAAGEDPNLDTPKPPKPKAKARFKPKPQADTETDAPVVRPRQR